MLNRTLVWRGTLSALLLVSALGLSSSAARADGDLQKVNHIIVVMQENRSFDHYFGLLPFVTGTPYHNAKGSGKKRACKPDDHTCVDGLNCSIPAKTGVLTCKNSNIDDAEGAAKKSKVKSFHETKYCTGPDLDHSWKGTHIEANFKKPGSTLKKTPMDGFVRLNDLTEQPDNGVESPNDDDTMGYYDDTDLPFYYSLAQTFAINDRYFCSVLGQTFPNRSYFLAGTSFGHLTTSEIFAGSGVAYKPITGTVFDMLNANGISWVNYAVDLPYSLIFEPAGTHVHPQSTFATDAAAGTLPAVSFVDASIISPETDEHPPADVRAGQQYVYQIVSALINSPSWSDSVLVLTYDEHGGFYDHAWPPAAPAPDNIAPGQCADDSNPPASRQPGGGVTCTNSATIEAPGQVAGAPAALCPTFSPTGPYPTTCPGFDQYGIRVPFVMVSPFAKPHYVSHTVGDHTSILALIENRFLNGQRLTNRDAAANDLEDMFDFDSSPSLNATIPAAPPPPASDHGCPFSG